MFPVAHAPSCLLSRKTILTVPTKDTIFCSDSKSALQYIANKSRCFHTFVANRVSEIHDATDPTQWRHVPGNWKPADDCARGWQIWISIADGLTAPPSFPNS